MNITSLQMTHRVPCVKKELTSNDTFYLKMEYLLKDFVVFFFLFIGIINKPCIQQIIWNDHLSSFLLSDSGIQLPTHLGSFIFTSYIETMHSLL